MPDMATRAGWCVGQVVVGAALLVMLAVVAGWDMWQSAQGHSERTASQIIGDWSARWPLLPLAIGLIIGHLFWPRR